MSMQPRYHSTLRNLTTATTVGALGTAMAVSGMTHQAPMGDYQPMGPAQNEIFRESRGLDTPTNVPRWDKQLSQQFDGFRNIENKPESAIPSRVAVVPKNGAPHTMGFDKAYRINNDNEPANNVWTVGWK